MDRNVKEFVDGWEISMQRNVHMYSHALTVRKGRYKFRLDSEDLVTEEKAIGIWLYHSKVPDSMITELQQVLLSWSKNLDVKVNIYHSRNEFVTNQ